MSVIRRAKRDTHFVQMDKRALQDVKLSWKAKGILAYLLSLPDDWQIYLKELQLHSTDGKDSTTNGFDELIERKYVVRTKKRKIIDGKKSGLFDGYDYVVSDTPIEIDLTLPCEGNPITVKPTSGKPTSENPQLVIIEYTNKEKELLLAESQKSENIETVLDENSECLQPFPENMPYGNGLKRAQEALNAYYAQDGKLDELKLEVGYDISSSFLDEQKKSFIEKMSNYAHNRARTFSQLKGFFVSWVRTGYERSQKEQTAKATITSVQADFTEQEISVAVADVLAQTEATAKGKAARVLAALKAKTAAQILQGFAEFLGKVKEHSASLKSYTPLTPKQLIWLELNCQDKNKLTPALLQIIKYRTKTSSLWEAIKIQLEL